MLLGTVAELSLMLAAGRTTSRRLVEQALTRIQDPAGEGGRAFMKVYGDAALAEADHSDHLRARGIVRSPVEGLPISIKDLFDISGDVTRAGSVALANNPPASRDAPAVARLRAAGAIIMGRTVTVEFAFGGVGLNPHYGTPRNPFDRASGGRIPGGSSSGAAVSVTDGMAVMGLGSDTRGSVRIPSALCGITGFKPTQQRVPRDRVFPLSYTLDSVGPLASSVACCAVYDAILANDGPASAAAPPPAVPPSRLRLLVPRRSLLFDDLEPAVGAAFDRALDVLRTAGATIVEDADVSAIERAQQLYNGGGFAAPEAYAIHRDLLAKHEAKYDPRVSSRIVMGADCKAADYVQLGLDRKQAVREISEMMLGFDAMVYPTCGARLPRVPASLSHACARACARRPRSALSDCTDRPCAQLACWPSSGDGADHSRGRRLRRRVQAHEPAPATQHGADERGGWLRSLAALPPLGGGTGRAQRGRPTHV